MSEEVKIYSLEERDSWIAEHAIDGLPSQSWAYAWALSVAGIAARLAVVRANSARMLLPFVERHWLGSADIATIIGISGASVVPTSAAPLAVWHEFARTRGWVAGYIQIAATTELPVGRCEGNGRIVVNNEVLLLDLRQGVPFDSLSDSIRRKIKRAEKESVELVEDRSVLTRALLRLHPQTMQRLGARADYRFPAATLERWAEDPTSLILGAAIGGEIAAIHLFLVCGGHAESHILAYQENGRDLNAWLIWNGICRLRQRGVAILNLSGGMWPGDGIYRFKQRFGAVPTPRRAVHQIYDQERYDELCRRSGVTPGGEWFPAYRARNGRRPG